MTALVDVLAVMKANASVCKEYLHQEYSRDMLEARAAVAELIGAAKQSRNTHKAKGGATADERDRAIERLAAAIERVMGVA